MTKKPVGIVWIPVNQLNPIKPLLIKMIGIKRTFGNRTVPKKAARSSHIEDLSDISSQSIKPNSSFAEEDWSCDPKINSPKQKVTNTKDDQENWEPIAKPSTARKANFAPDEDDWDSPPSNSHKPTSPISYKPASPKRDSSPKPANNTSKNVDKDNWASKAKDNFDDFNWACTDTKQSSSKPLADSDEEDWDNPAPTRSTSATKSTADYKEKEWGGNKSKYNNPFNNDDQDWGSGSKFNESKSKKSYDNKPYGKKGSFKSKFFNQDDWDGGGFNQPSSPLSPTQQYPKKKWDSSRKSRNQYDDEDRFSSRSSSQMKSVKSFDGSESDSRRSFTPKPRKSGNPFACKKPKDDWKKSEASTSSWQSGKKYDEDNWDKASSSKSVKPWKPQKSYDKDDWDKASTSNSKGSSWKQQKTYEEDDWDKPSTSNSNTAGYQPKKEGYGDNDWDKPNTSPAKTSTWKQQKTYNEDDWDKPSNSNTSAYQPQKGYDNDWDKPNTSTAKTSTWQPQQGNDEDDWDKPSNSNSNTSAYQPQKGYDDNDWDKSDISTADNNSSRQAQKGPNKYKWYNPNNPKPKKPPFQKQKGNDEDDWSNPSTSNSKTSSWPPQKGYDENDWDKPITANTKTSSWQPQQSYDEDDWDKPSVSNTKDSSWASPKHANENDWNKSSTSNSNNASWKPVKHTDEDDWDKPNTPLAKNSTFESGNRCDNSWNKAQTSSQSLSAYSMATKGQTEDNWDNKTNSKNPASKDDDYSWAQPDNNKPLNMKQTVAADDEDNWDSLDLRQPVAASNKSMDSQDTKSQSIPTKTEPDFNDDWDNEPIPLSAHMTEEDDDNWGDADSKTTPSPKFSPASYIQSPTSYTDIPDILDSDWEGNDLNYEDIVCEIADAISDDDFSFLQDEVVPLPQTFGEAVVKIEMDDFGSNSASNQFPVREGEMMPYDLGCKVGLLAGMTSEDENPYVPEIKREVTTPVEDSCEDVSQTEGASNTPIPEESSGGVAPANEDNDYEPPIKETLENPKTIVSDGKQDELIPGEEGDVQKAKKTLEESTNAISHEISAGIIFADGGCEGKPCDEEILSRTAVPDESCNTVPQAETVFETLLTPASDELLIPTIFGDGDCSYILKPEEEFNLSNILVPHDILREMIIDDGGCQHVPQTKKTSGNTIIPVPSETAEDITPVDEGFAGLLQALECEKAAAPPGISEDTIPSDGIIEAHEKEMSVNKTTLISTENQGKTTSQLGLCEDEPHLAETAERPKTPSINENLGLTAVVDGSFKETPQTFESLKTIVSIEPEKEMTPEELHGEENSQVLQTPDTDGRSDGTIPDDGSREDTKETSEKPKTPVPHENSEVTSFDKGISDPILQTKDKSPSIHKDQHKTTPGDGHHQDKKHTTQTSRESKTSHGKSHRTKSDSERRNRDPRTNKTSRESKSDASSVKSEKKTHEHRSSSDKSHTKKTHDKSKSISHEKSRRTTSRDGDRDSDRTKKASRRSTSRRSHDKREEKEPDDGGRNDESRKDRKTSLSREKSRRKSHDRASHRDEANNNPEATTAAKHDRDETHGKKTSRRSRSSVDESKLDDSKDPQVKESTKESKTRGHHRKSRRTISNDGNSDINADEKRTSRKLKSHPSYEKLEETKLDEERNEDVPPAEQTKSNTISDDGGNEDFTKKAIIKITTVDSKEESEETANNEKSRDDEPLTQRTSTISKTFVPHEKLEAITLIIQECDDKPSEETSEQETAVSQEKTRERIPKVRETQSKETISRSKSPAALQKQEELIFEKESNNEEKQRESSATRSRKSKRLIADEKPKITTPLDKSSDDEPLADHRSKSPAALQKQEELTPEKKSKNEELRRESSATRSRKSKRLIPDEKPKITTSLDKSSDDEPLADCKSKSLAALRKQEELTPESKKEEPRRESSATRSKKSKRLIPDEKPKSTTPLDRSSDDEPLADKVTRKSIPSTPASSKEITSGDAESCDKLREERTPTKSMTHINDPSPKRTTPKDGTCDNSPQANKSSLSHQDGGTRAKRISSRKSKTAAPHEKLDEKTIDAEKCNEKIPTNETSIKSKIAASPDKAEEPSLDTIIHTEDRSKSPTIRQNPEATTPDKGNNADKSRESSPKKSRRSKPLAPVEKVKAITSHDSSSDNEPLTKFCLKSKVAAAKTPRAKRSRKSGPPPPPPHEESQGPTPHDESCDDERITMKSGQSKLSITHKTLEETTPDEGIDKSRAKEISAETETPVSTQQIQKMIPGEEGGGNLPRGKKMSRRSKTLISQGNTEESPTDEGGNTQKSHDGSLIPHEIPGGTTVGDGAEDNKIPKRRGRKPRRFESPATPEKSKITIQQDESGRGESPETLETPVSHEQPEKIVSDGANCDAEPIKKISRRSKAFISVEKPVEPTMDKDTSDEAKTKKTTRRSKAPASDDKQKEMTPDRGELDEQPPAKKTSRRSKIALQPKSPEIHVVKTADNDSRSITTLEQSPSKPLLQQSPSTPETEPHDGIRIVKKVRRSQLSLLIEGEHKESILDPTENEKKAVEESRGRLTRSRTTVVQKDESSPRGRKRKRSVAMSEDL